MANQQKISIDVDQQLWSGVRLTATASHVSVGFDEPQQVMSSAFYNGGLGQARHFLNLAVGHQKPAYFDNPQRSFVQYLNHHQLPDNTVGMMTAATMASLRWQTEILADEYFAVILTSGLGNALCAGDKTSPQVLHSPPLSAGTINIAVLTSCQLTQAALVESHGLIAEAKAAALLRLGIKSTVSNAIATGTGTDSAAVFCALQGKKLTYMGKHTWPGERIAAMVIRCLLASARQRCVQ